MASRRLLLVEDSSTMRRMLSTMLMEERTRGREVLRGRDRQRRSSWARQGFAPSRDRN